MQIKEIINLVADELNLCKYEREILALPYSSTKTRNAFTIILKLCQIDEQDPEEVRKEIVSIQTWKLSMNRYNYSLVRFYQLIDRDLEFTRIYNKCLNSYLTKADVSL